jgi:hypothetical protein
VSRSDFVVELLIERLEQVMADLSGLTAAVSALVEAQSTVVTALGDLKDKVIAAEAGSPSQADVDALTAQVAGVSGALTTAVAQNDPAPAPAVPAS